MKCDVHGVEGCQSLGCKIWRSSMKRIFVLLILLLTLPAYGQEYARMGLMMTASGGGAAATCNTQAAPTDMETLTGNQNVLNGANDWWATKFASDGSTICGIQLWFDGTTTTVDPVYTGNVIYVYIYDDNAGVPNTMVANFGTITTVGLGTAGWSAKATGSAALTNTSIYHIVITSASIDGTNVLRWGKDNSCATEKMNFSADGLTWNNAGTSDCFLAKLFKSP